MLPACESTAAPAGSAGNSLEEQGWELRESAFADTCLEELGNAVFGCGAAGTRCQLDHELVASAARFLLEELSDAGCLSRDAVAIQAIAFDKTVGTNWKVAWHQDLMFPFARRVEAAGFDLPAKKEGIDYARPPRGVLEEMVAARLHLDDCGETNGPLRVSPGTHRHGVLRSAEVTDYVSLHGQVSCLAKKGDVLLMKPLTLHASSPALNPAHRRVLHFVFHSGAAIAEPWYRAIGLTGSGK
jgi:ectoine hydroxylase-related dioxygenase (phytanoyl-CoA dioxygenase family)